MKHWFTLFILFFTTLPTFGQFWTEDWDSPKLWRTRDLDSDSPATVWAPLDVSTLPGAIATFQNCVLSVSNNKNPDELLISPQIDITNIQGNMKLAFDIFSQGGSDENYAVYVVTDTVGIAATINAVTPVYGEIISVANSNTILYREVDLTSFIGGTQIYLIFRHRPPTTPATATGIALDNIKLYDSFQISNTNVGCIGSTFTFTQSCEGAYNAYVWDFGMDASPATASGPGPHSVTYTTLGAKTITLLALGTDNVHGDSNEFILTVANSPVPSFSSDISLGCNPAEVTFTNTNPNTNCLYTFSDGFTSNSCSVKRTFSTSGTYSVSLTETIDPACIGTTTNTNMITINDSPTADFIFSNDNPDMVYPYLTMVNRSDALATAYIWDFGDNSIGNTDISPTHLFPEGVAGEYEVELTAIAANGCTDSITKILIIRESILIFIPNGFTPNGDELNNRFEPTIFSGVDPQNYSMMIFDRYGEVIFESKDPEVGWDGDYGAGRGLAPTGTYTYKLEFSTKEQDEKRLMLGHVTLVR